MRNYRNRKRRVGEREPILHKTLAKQKKDPHLVWGELAKHFGLIPTLLKVDFTSGLCEIIWNSVPLSYGICLHTKDTLKLAVVDLEKLYISKQSTKA